MRRFGLGLGLFLIAVGWGATDYASVQQGSFTNRGAMTDHAAFFPVTAWLEGFDTPGAGWPMWPGARVHAIGVALLAVGAGITGLSAPRRQPRAASQS